jgi:hypothetical protein
MPIRHAVLALTVLLVSCATPYQPLGLTGGYSEARFDETTYEIAFKANGFTSSDEVQRDILFRAAELTSQAGFDHFVITDAKDLSRVVQQTTPATATTLTNLYGGANVSGQVDQDGNISGYGATNLSNPPTPTFQPARTTFVIKPGERMLIKMGKGTKPEIQNAYQVTAILRYVGPSIKRP